MATDHKKVEAGWSNLPNELLPLIAKHLNATIDILRFRSTCTSWRSAIPHPPPSSQTLIPLPPPPFSRTIFSPRNQNHAKFALVQTKIYRLQPSSTSATDSSNKGWIIMVPDFESLPVRLLDPFTNKPLSDTHPKVLNLLNFRVIDLIEAYSLNFGAHHEDDRKLGSFLPVPEVLKVVLFPSLTFPSKSSRMVLALYEDGKLRVSKIGDEVWTVLDDGNSRFDDVIVHMGQLYVVDKWGTVLWVDCSSLTLVEFYPKLPSSGKKKRLVECNGSLYVVDICIERECHHPKGVHWEDIVDVKVFRLDEEGARWLHVKDLGDVVFVLGKSSNFSLSAKDYYECEGNCVYFYSNRRVRAFSLESSKFKRPKLFWPCPSLFESKFSL